jgi:hypothetical protein
VASGNNIDVFRAFFLQFEANSGKFIRRNDPSPAFVALFGRNLPVLAQGTPQIAPGNENGTRSAGPAQGWLLAAVQSGESKP